MFNLGLKLVAMTVLLKTIKTVCVAYTSNCFLILPVMLLMRDAILNMSA